MNHRRRLEWSVMPDRTGAVGSKMLVPDRTGAMGSKMKLKDAFVCSCCTALLTVLACASRQRPPSEELGVARHEERTLPIPSPTRDPWATAAELELQRRGGDGEVIRITAVRCETLQCTLTIGVDTKSDALARRLDAWLRENWTFRWKIESAPEADVAASKVRITLYRHPADTGGQQGSFSSFSGSSVNACQRGADCRHPNWDEPSICERTATQCPAITLDGVRWCFDSFQTACDCAKLRGMDIERDLPGCNSEGYPY